MMDNDNDREIEAILRLALALKPADSPRAERPKTFLVGPDVKRAEGGGLVVEHWLSEIPGVDERIFLQVSGADGEPTKARVVAFAQERTEELELDDAGCCEYLLKSGDRADDLYVVVRGSDGRGLDLVVRGAAAQASTESVTGPLAGWGTAIRLEKPVEWCPTGGPLDESTPKRVPFSHPDGDFKVAFKKRQGGGLLVGTEDISTRLLKRIVITLHFDDGNTVSLLGADLTLEGERWEVERSDLSSVSVTFLAEQEKG